MAHREAPRLRGRSHEACGHERVERVEGLALGDTRHRRDGVGLEVDADDRRGIEDGAHVGRERSALLRERRRHRVRHARELHLARGARDGSPVVEAPGQVLEVEGVAAALEVEQVSRPLGRVGTEEARRRDEVEGCEDELDPAVLTQRTGERDLQTLRSLVPARRERQEDLGGGRAAQQRCDEVDGRRIGPVQVVEDHHERPIRGERREQRAHGGVHAVAFRHGRARIVCQGRQRLRERRRVALGQVGRPGRGDVRLERVDPDGERQVDLVLRGATGHDHRAPVGRPEPELLQQPRLADARLAGHDERGRAAGPEIVEDPVEDADLCVPTDQRRLGAMAHRATIGPSARRDPLTGARRPGVSGP